MKALQLVPSESSIAARILVPLLLLALSAAAVWGYGVRQYRAGVEAGRADVREEGATKSTRRTCAPPRPGTATGSGRCARRRASLRSPMRFLVRSKLLLSGAMLACPMG